MTTIGIIGAGNIGQALTRSSLDAGYDVVLANSRGPETLQDRLPVQPLAGKVVVDTGNYYPQRDGRIAELEDESSTTSEIVQRHLGSARVVKGFNHILAADLTTRGTPGGTPHRRALAIAGDDALAKETVASYMDAWGSTSSTSGSSPRAGGSSATRPGTGPTSTSANSGRPRPGPGGTAT